MTSNHIWSSEVDATCATPYLSLLKRITFARYLKRKFYCYGEDVDVVDGEGLLEHGSGYVQGLKLNGKPIIASWDDNAGSVGRFLVRSKVLTKNEISHITKSVESYLNAPHLDLSVLAEKMTPFLKCMQSGTYRINVERSEDFISLLHYRTTSDLTAVENNYADHLQLNCTQPSDSLNESRIKYYEDQLKKDARPAILTIRLDYRDAFLIDGHHKVEAYFNLGLSKEILFVHIEPIDFPMIQREEELKYVIHSANALQSYHTATDQFFNNNHH